MLIYWLLFAYPAVLALTYPARLGERQAPGVAQSLARWGFVVFYTLLAGLRYDVGGDWGNYEIIYEDIRLGTLAHALDATDPLYGLANWVSAQFDTGVYFVNGICAFVLVCGVVSVSSRFSEPWLAIAISVPYLLIVVGLGYVRQGAAIGMVLLAVSAFERERMLGTVALLFVAVGFHSTAVIVFPLFAWGFVRHYGLVAILFIGIIIATYFAFVVPRIDRFYINYIQAEYDSAGALPRVLMSAIPGALLILRWQSFGEQLRSRLIWLSMAVAAVAALGALALVQSSTAVDRTALFFSPVQMAAFGEFRRLTNLSNRAPLIHRSALIALAAFVQVVWLVYATNAPYWVPYQSLFDAGAPS
jgi:hypothetical protein